MAPKSRTSLVDPRFSARAPVSMSAVLAASKIATIVASSRVAACAAAEEPGTTVAIEAARRTTAAVSGDLRISSLLKKWFGLADTGRSASAVVTMGLFVLFVKIFFEIFDIMPRFP
jgi:hypothetical protein